MSFDFKSATPANFASGGFLFGADSQVATDPSIYSDTGLLSFFSSGITTMPNLTTVGTIGTGTWQGTAVGISYGGTGQTSKAAAFDALSPMSASGDIIYGGASGTGTRLAKGTDGQVLTLAAGVPSWADGGGGSWSALSGSVANGGFTLTVPTLSASDTLVVLGLAQTFTTLKTFSAGLSIASGQSLDWNSDTKLFRDAANAIGLRNAGTAGTPVPQALNVYNFCATVATDAEWGYAKWVSNVFRIGTAAAVGTGSVRNLIFDIGGANKLDYGVTAASTWTLAGTLATSNINVASNTITISNGAIEIAIWNGGHIGWSSSASSAGTIDIGLYRNAAGVIEVNNGVSGTYRDLKARALIVNDGTQMLKSSAAFTDGAGASAGTLTNAPAVGNPTKWIAINDNGTTRYIPAW